ncbi:MAG TPA: hypothetical protein VF178_08635 [Gemmatimonadaceae bacterium]
MRSSSRGTRVLTGPLALLLALSAHVRAQEPMATGSPACDVLTDSVPRRGSPVAFLHPSRVTDRYAEPIAGRRWLVVFGSLKADIDTAFASLAQRPGATPAFQTAEAQMRQVIDSMGRQLLPVIEAPLSQRPALLVPLEISQFEPFQSPSGEGFVVLHSDRDESRPTLLLVRDSLRLAEYEALCWASRSQSRFLGAFNFEAAPIGNATIDRLAREWQSYRENSPVQLPHELILNRALRALFVKSREQRYHPSRFDLVALHPFAGFEVARRGDGTLDKHESYAVELGGITLWGSGWRRHYGASWMVTYDPDGRVGWGPLVRVSGYFTTGLVYRRDSSGVRRKSLLVTVDLLRFLRLDAAEMALRQAKGVANALVDGAASRR